MTSLILPHLPIEPGTTQICSEGSRVSSYETEDGVPFVSESTGLRFGLECKRAFDESWYSINEPEPEVERVIPTPPIPVVMTPCAPTYAPPIVLKQPAPASDALEEHTTVANEGMNRLDDLASYVKNRSSQSDLTPNSAQEGAESKLIDSQSDDSEVCEVLATTPVTGNTTEIASQTLVNSPQIDPKQGVEPQGEEIPAPELVTGNCQLSVTGSEAHSEMPKSIPLSSAPQSTKWSRRGSWTMYPRPAAATPASTPRTTNPVADEPEDSDQPVRGRSTRKTSVRTSSNVPAHVKAAKIDLQDNKCIYCKRRFGTPILHDGEVEILKAVPDHFIGRRTSDSNINMSCHPCNDLKSDFLFASIADAATWLNNKWGREGYTDCPLLIPFKRLQAFAASAN